MPAHEFGLVVDSGQVGMLVFLKLGIDVKGEWPHPCCLLLLLVSLF